MSRWQDECGIDVLRSVVNWCQWQNETFNQSFTVEELIKLWKFAASKEGGTVPEFADTWPEPLIQKALLNRVYCNYKYSEDCGKRCNCQYCRKAYNREDDDDN